MLIWHFLKKCQFDINKYLYYIKLIKLRLNFFCVWFCKIKGLLGQDSFCLRQLYDS